MARSSSTDGGAARYYVGVDVGTSSSKGVLVGGAGEVIARATQPHGVQRPAEGWYEQDADALWWHDVVGIVRELMAQVAIDPGTVAGVAVSAIGPCVLPLDRTGRPLRPGILYGIDSRAVGLIDSLDRQLRSVGRGVELSSQSVVPKLAWLAEHEPEVWARTAMVVGAEGYLVYRLTGRYVLDIYDAGQYEPLVAEDGERWLPGYEWLVRRDQLPELLWPGEIAGRLTEEAAAELGLVAGTPVACGLVDAPAEATSVGAVCTGDLMVMVGSTGFLIAQTAEPLRSPHLWSARGFEPGRHVMAGGMNTVGTLLTWARELLAPEFASDPDAGHAALIKEGWASPPGARGVRVLPYWAGERTPVRDPDVRGVMCGLGLEHDRGDVYRAVVEAIALGIRDNIEAFVQAGATVDRIVAVGGGARNSLLLQTIADATGREVWLPTENAGAAYGDAMRAAVAIGDFADLAEVTGAWVRYLDPVRPRPELATVYEDSMVTYRSLYQVAKTLGA